MADRDAASQLIDRIIRESHIPTARDRDELRRELESHFAEAGSSPDALRAAVERFGSPLVVSRELAHAHRRRRLVSKLMRIVIAVGASLFVALAIQIAANLRLGTRGASLELMTFTRSTSFSALIVVVLVTAWELDIESLCARLERRPVRLLLTLAALAASMVLFHSAGNNTLPPETALFSSAVDVAIWTCTVAILARTDRAFARVFKPMHR
jgi:hypothetical protein